MSGALEMPCLNMVADRRDAAHRVSQCDHVKEIQSDKCDLGAVECEGKDMAVAADGGPDVERPQMQQLLLGCVPAVYHLGRVVGCS
jgi:hypothetical protein